MVADFRDSLTIKRRRATRTVRFLKADNHCFIWSYRPETLQATKRHIGQLAADPTISLDWHDAAKIIAFMRKMESVIERMEPAKESREVAPRQE